MLQRQYANATQCLLAAPGLGHYIGLGAGGSDAHEQTADGRIVDLIFLASYLQGRQQLGGELLFQFVPMGAWWVQKELYGVVFTDTTGRKAQ